MNDKTARTMYITGKILLGIFIACDFSFLLRGMILAFRDPSAFDRWIMASLGILLFILIVAVFLVKKFPIMVGIVIWGIGVAYAILQIIDPLPDFFAYRYFFISLIVWLFTLDGYLFIEASSIERNHRYLRIWATIIFGGMTVSFAVLLIAYMSIATATEIASAWIPSWICLGPPTLLFLSIGLVLLFRGLPQISVKEKPGDPIAKS